ncbi:MAG: hypothetical protein IPK97_10415 [Ahniella sp.]|nr:hypothetical protein [Ahniella sp.]
MNLIGTLERLALMYDTPPYPVITQMLQSIQGFVRVPLLIFVVMFYAGELVS